MAQLDIRQRAGYLFLAVTLGHVILISAQVNSTSGVPILEMVTFGIFSEAQRSVSSVLTGAQRFWSGYVSLRGVEAENERLRREVADVQVQLQQQRALADRTRTLEALLALRDRVDVKTAAAEIIAVGATPDFRTVTLDKGTAHGVQRDMAVIAPGGIVGRVVTPTARAAKVQLIVDRNAAAGALIERSRAQGVVTGQGDQRLRMEYVSELSDVAVGDVVMTSGVDGIYPKGFIIGRVDSVEKTGVAWDIGVTPAVDFSKLEEVLVVLTPNPGREAAAENDR